MNLAATMSLNSGAFERPLAGVRSGLAGVVGQIRSLAPLVTGLGATFVAFKSAHAIVENFFAAFERGHELERFHRITGESITDIVILQRAMKNAGGDGGDLQRQLIMLQKSLGGVNENGEPTKKIFDQLGLSIDGLKAMKAPEQLEAIGVKIRALPNAAERTAAAMAIFGRSGAEMLALLNDPDALKEAMKSARETGLLYERNAKIFSEIARLMNQIKGKVSTLFAGLAEGAAPAFRQLLLWVKEIDLAKIGRDIGSLLRAIPAAIQSGRIGELLELTLQLGFAKAINFFTAGLRKSFEIIGAVFSATFANIGSIADALLGVAAQFGAALLKAVQRPLAYIQAGMEAVFDNLNQADQIKRAQDFVLANDPRFAGKTKGEIDKAPGILGALSRNPTEEKLYQDFYAAVGKRRDDTEGKSQTLGERMDRIMKAGGPRFGFGGATMNADEIGDAAKAQTDAALARLTPALAELAAKIGSIAKSAKIEDVAGSAGISAQLKALIKSLVPATVGAPEEKLGGTGAGLGAGLGGVKAPKIETDRLARVGGFIGGAGGPALDYARRTASAVERVAQHTAALLHRQATPSHGAVWGSYDGARAPLY